MFKPLDRPIAVVVADHAVDSSNGVAIDGKFLTTLIEEFAAQSTVFAASKFSSIDDSKFEAILLVEVELDASPGASTDAVAAKLLRKFHSQSKPIAAIGKSVLLVAKTFAPEGIEVTTGEDASLGVQVTGAGALHTMCPANDYVSDRDNKTLTTPGSLFTGPEGPAKTAAIKEGIRKMLRELVEMA